MEVWKLVSIIAPETRYRTKHMATAKKNAPSKAHVLTCTKQTDESPLQLSITIKRGIYNRLNKYRKDKGLSTEQDVIRLAIAMFLERNDY